PFSSTPAVLLLARLLRHPPAPAGRCANHRSCVVVSNLLDNVGVTGATLGNGALSENEQSIVRRRRQLEQYQERSSARAPGDPSAVHQKECVLCRRPLATIDLQRPHLPSPVDDVELDVAVSFLGPHARSCNVRRLVSRTVSGSFRSSSGGGSTKGYGPK